MCKPLKTSILFLFISVQVIAQSSDSKWAFGASFGIAKFSSSDAKIIGDQFNFQIPRINATRYFFSGLTLDAGASFNTINKIPGVISNSLKYFSLDGAVRYDFGRSQDDLVPYVSIGGSLYSLVSKATLPESLLKELDKMTLTFNFGGGGTYWFNSTYGVNAQLIYKHSLSKLTNIGSHGYFSIGVVYSLSPRTLIPRLWNNN